MAQTLPSKDVVVLKLLEEGDTMLCLDARHQGVVVPREHVQNPALRLILNLSFPHPIHVTATGISADLSFGGRRHRCYIPMDALWAVFNPQTMQGMMWPESIPAEVQAEMAAQPAHSASNRAPEQPTTPPPAPGKRRRNPPGKDDTTSRQRGHLRIVK